jgi:hypothetical protein
MNMTDWLQNPNMAAEYETLLLYVEYLESMFGNHYEAFVDAGLDPYNTNEEE